MGISNSGTWMIISAMSFCIIEFHTCWCVDRCISLAWPVELVLISDDWCTAWGSPWGLLCIRFLLSFVFNSFCCHTESLGLQVSCIKQEHSKVSMVSLNLCILVVPRETAWWHWILHQPPFAFSAFPPNQKTDSVPSSSPPCSVAFSRERNMKIRFPVIALFGSNGRRERSNPGKATGKTRKRSHGWWRGTTRNIALNQWAPTQTDSCYRLISL